MMCSNPYRQGVAEFGCGQCLPCRLNRKRLWTARLMLEAEMHAASWFVTLTFDEEHVPSDYSVSPREFQLFMKALRARIAPERVRFYGVGEYGEEAYRPHYHVALFGLSDPCHVSPADAELWGMPPCDCVVCDAWGKGGVDVGDLTAQSAAYIVSYITAKDDRHKADPGHPLYGKHPPFARMSLRPGLGALAVPMLEKVVTSEHGCSALVESGDVPEVFRREARVWPLGRYLRRKLRAEIGMDESQPAAVAEGRSREMQALLREEGARAAREDQRLHVARRADALERISKSKKGKL